MSAASSLPPPLAWAPGSNVCPVHRIDHRGENCPDFWKAYGEHNAAGLAKYARQSRPEFRPSERVALLLRVRTLLSQCSTREAMIAALDEIIRAIEAGGAL